MTIQAFQHFRMTDGTPHKMVSDARERDALFHRGPVPGPLVVALGSVLGDVRLDGDELLKIHRVVRFDP